MKWINVKERLPEEGKRVLCYITRGDSVYDIQKVLFQSGGVWDDYHSSVTHWMPLPEAPKK